MIVIDKDKRSVRLHKSKVAALKQKRIAKAFGLPNKPIHYYNKHHALDCGNTKCQVCHSDKVFNKPTIQEKRFAQGCKSDNLNS